MRFGRRMDMVIRTASLGVLSLLTILALPSSSHSVERAHEFLDGLRQRGYFDSARDYLEQSSKNPLVANDFKQAIAYHQGETLLEEARRMADASLREKKLDESIDRFRAFVEAEPGSALAPKAMSLIASVHVERGRGLVRQASLPGHSEEKDAILTKARSLFDQADSMFQEAVQHYSEALKQYPKILDPKTEASKIELRRHYRGELVNAQLLAANVFYERGKTYSEGSPPFSEHLTEAAQRYAKLYEEYRKWLAGLYAHLSEGRCYQTLGELDKAIGCYEDLIQQPADEPAFRSLIAKATLFQLECYVGLEKYDQAVAKGTAWLADRRGGEKRQSIGLGIKYHVALAHQRKGAAAASGSPEQRKRFKMARNLIRELGQFRSEYNTPAQQLLPLMGAAARDGAPKTFGSAFEKAREAFELFGSVKAALRLAAENNSKNDPRAVADLQRQYATHRDSASDYYRAALRLADRETPIEELNQARYHLCYIYWESGRYYDAAVLGEFLARRYPESAGARQGAKIAMAAYQRNYLGSQESNAQWEARRIEEIADMIVQRWPDSSDADDAYDVLVHMEVNQGNLKEARKRLAKISPDRRGRSEAKVGLAIWSSYLRNARLEPPNLPPRSVLNELKRQATEHLLAGIKGLSKRDRPDTTLAAAALSLVQIHLDNGDYGDAIELLEHKQVGPLALVDSAPLQANRSSYVEETYKAALRAYVSVRPPDAAKAEAIMDSLERHVSQADADHAVEKLTKIYVGLGRQLEQQLKELRQSGELKEYDRVAKAFEAFLDRIANRGEGQDWASRVWVAQTYYNLASSQNITAGLTEQATNYYTKSAAAFDRLVQDVESDDSLAPNENAVLGLLMRKAECLSKLRQHKQAIDVLSTVLAEKPNMLDAQRAAARAYQMRGEDEKAIWFLHAMKGGRSDKKTGQNRIWGWSKLARIAVRYKQHHDVFYESRFHLAQCRLQYALRQTGDARKKYLGLAKNDLRYTVELYPDLGGEKWRPKYVQLLKDVQTESGDEPIGLQEFSREANKTGKTVRK